MRKRFLTSITLALCMPASMVSGQDRPQDSAAAAKQDFVLINKTGVSVVSFNASPSEEEEWGPNILGQQVLKSGESAKITFEHDATACLWDLRATYEDDDTTEMNKVDLCEVATVTLNP